MHQSPIQREDKRGQAPLVEAAGYAESVGMVTLSRRVLQRATYYLSTVNLKKNSRVIEWRTERKCQWVYVVIMTVGQEEVRVEWRRHPQETSISHSTLDSLVRLQSSRSPNFRATKLPRVWVERETQSCKPCRTLGRFAQHSLRRVYRSAPACGGTFFLHNTIPFPPFSMTRTRFTQPVRTWKFLPDLVIVRTPLYGRYFSLKIWSEVMASPDTDAIGTFNKGVKRE